MLPVQAAPRIVEEASMELSEKQYETKVNVTIHRSGDIFDYIDIQEGVLLSHNSSQGGGGRHHPANELKQGERHI